jgi:hypothetical protein
MRIKLILEVLMSNLSTPSDPLPSDLEEVINDYRRLTKELDDLLNGDSAAIAPSLCDIVAQVRNEKWTLVKTDPLPSDRDFAMQVRNSFTDFDSDTMPWSDFDKVWDKAAALIAAHREAAEKKAREDEMEKVAIDAESFCMCYGFTFGAKAFYDGLRAAIMQGDGK